MSDNQLTAKAITVSYNPDLITWRFIRDLIKLAQERNQEAEMTKHLVGAMLHLAFPGAVVDDPTSQMEGKTALLGDYLVGDTVFHVILAPVMPVYDHCRTNIDQGFQVFLLVTDKYFCGTRQNAEIILPGKVMVASIESFICQALERLAGFSKKQMGEAIRQMLLTYNDRVRNLETDQTLLIQVPPNLIA